MKCIPNTSLCNCCYYCFTQVYLHRTYFAKQFSFRSLKEKKSTNFHHICMPYKRIAWEHFSASTSYIKNVLHTKCKQRHGCISITTLWVTRWIGENPFTIETDKSTFNKVLVYISHCRQDGDIWCIHIHRSIASNVLFGNFYGALKQKPVLPIEIASIQSSNQARLSIQVLFTTNSRK